MICVIGTPGERRVALVQDGVLAEFAIWRPGAPDGIGDEYVGRVVAKVPAMAGSFVALDAAEAFLPDSEAPMPLGAGDHVTVRVTRAAQAGKGPRVSARLAQLGGGPVRLVRRGPSPLDELIEAHPEEPVIAIGPGPWAPPISTGSGGAGIGRRALDGALAGQIAALEDPLLRLPGGMSATITPSPALVAIDVDAGGATADRAAKATSQVRANRAAIPELARQIRLRNLSGAILIDFAGMSAKRRPMLAPDLQEALAADRLRPRLVGFSNLGFAEILRSRIRPPLHELLAGPHAAGLAALRRIVTDHPPGARLLLRAGPAIVSALQADPVALRELAQHTSSVVLRSDPTLPAEFRIVETPSA